MLQKDYPEKDKYEPFCIVRLNKEPEKITVNLKAPLYIDQENRKGYQTILDSDDFPLDYKLFIKEAK
jgi:flagellar assembly factor FliW